MADQLTKTISLPFEQALAKVTEELKKDGFGIITEIDVRETLKKKLNVDFRKYHILGACNPQFAYQALQIDDKVGTMLPCNVIVQEKSGGIVEVTAVDPAASSLVIKNARLLDLALQVRTKLSGVVARL
jgi:uncharacterized protein (DUF302 family)